VSRLASGEFAAHAVLLYGAPGSGKGELARLLAQAWLCLSPGPEGADGTCRACGSFERGNSPDLLRIAPQGPSAIIAVKTITNDKQKPDDPTPLIEFFRTLPLGSRNRVAIIEDAHRMNGDASNALLKTLEEPHPHAKLVLTTDSVSGVLPTILSRCLAVACEVPPVEALRAQFPEATEDDLRMAENAPGRLRAILGNPIPYRRLAAFGRGLTSRKPGEALVAAEELRSISDALDGVLKCGARAANTEVLSMLAAFLARDPNSPAEWAQYVAEAHRRIVGNGSPGLVFDALLSRILLRR